MKSDDAARLATKLRAILPHLDERQRRLLLGAEARFLGHGGIRLVARAAGADEATVSAGIRELDSAGEPLWRARRPGGGRKRLAHSDPGLVPALLALVEPQDETLASPLRWTTKSTRKLASELTAAGHQVSADTVGDLLRGEGFRLRGRIRTRAGAAPAGRRHADLNAQYRYISKQVITRQATCDPVISVSSQKLAGRTPLTAREWWLVGDLLTAGPATANREAGTPLAGGPLAVNGTRLPQRGLGRAGASAARAGWVSTDTDQDTADLAVESIRRWWSTAGSDGYPRARRLLIIAEPGGSPAYRTHVWQTGLAALAVKSNMKITVCQLPPGTSRWSHLEYYALTGVTLNTRRGGTVSREVIVRAISAAITTMSVMALLLPGLTAAVARPSARAACAPGHRRRRTPARLPEAGEPRGAAPA